MTIIGIEEGRYTDFGQAEKHFYRRKGEPVKPDRELWLLIRERAAGPFGYIGDQETDIQFIMQQPDVHAILMPKSQEDERIIRSYIRQDHKLEQRVTIIRRDELFKTGNFAIELSRMIYILQKNSSKKTKGKPKVNILTDVDDTLHPKERAQSYALSDTIKILKDEQPLLYTQGAVDFLRQSVKKKGRFDNPKFYADLRLALAMKCISQYYLLNDIGPAHAEDITDDVINLILTSFADKERQLVESMQDTQALGLKIHDCYQAGLDQSKSLYTSHRIYAHHFREREVARTIELVKNGKIYLYKEVFPILINYIKSNRINVTIVTRKPEEVFEAIADMPMEIK